MIYLSHSAEYIRMHETGFARKIWDFEENFVQVNNKGEEIPL